MIKYNVLMLSLLTISSCVKIKTQLNDISQRNFDLFKHDPSDEYTLPENIDIDKPPTNFVGDIMQAKTVLLENKNHGKGKFKYSLETQNGIEITQVGKLKDANTFIVSGSYSYTGADGRRYKVKYTADEFGYHPITELDVDIPEILDQNSIIQPFKLIDLDEINRYSKVRKTENYKVEHNTENQGHGGYDYPIPVNEDLRFSIPSGQDQSNTKYSDQSFYTYPLPSLDLESPSLR